MDGLEELAGHRFQDRGILTEALTHPSVIHEGRRRVPDNQRLEFLGDAVLQMLCTEYLYDQLAGAREGDMTKRRAFMVNREAMCQLARRIGLGRHLILGRNEAASGGHDRPSNLSDAMEAVIGAVYRDGGWEAARRMGRTLLEPFWREQRSDAASDNPKGRLQEILQGMSPDAPEYVTLSAEGPDHAKTYDVEVRWRGRKLGRGTGASKKEAESRAAAAALAAEGWGGMAPAGSG